MNGREAFPAQIGSNGSLEEDESKNAMLSKVYFDNEPLYSIVPIVPLQKCDAISIQCICMCA